VLRRQLQINAGCLAIGRSVLDPNVGEGDLAVCDSEVMLGSNLLLPAAELFFRQLRLPWRALCPSPKAKSSPPTTISTSLIPRAIGPVKLI